MQRGLGNKRGLNSWASRPGSGRVQSPDAPKTTKSMHIVISDLGLEQLWVAYPGELEYPLADRITALPLGGVRPLTLR